MRTTTFSAALILLFTSLPLTARAEGSSLSLQGAIDSAVQNSPQLRKAELSEDSAKWGELEALSGHLPQLSIRGTHFFSAKYSRLGVVFGGQSVEIPSAFPQTEFDLEASLNIFDGFATYNRYGASRLEHDAAKLELSHARFQLAEEIRVRFYQALAAQELAKVADLNIHTLEDHLNLVRASERAGVSTRVDTLRLESLLEEARAEKILADDNVVVARRALNEEVGVPEDSRALEGALPMPDAKQIPANLNFDASHREDIEAQTRHEQAQDRLSSAAKGVWLPQVALFASKQFYKYGDFDPAVIPTPSYRNAYNVGFRLSWDLFNGGASIARSARASDAAKITAENTRQELISSPNDFETWRRRFVYNAALFQARKRSVVKSEESVRLATLSVRAGTKTHSEALDAELDLFRARAGVIRAQADAAEALARLELSVGHSL